MPKNKKTGLRFQKPNVNRPLGMTLVQIRVVRSDKETRDTPRIGDVGREF